MSKFENMKRIRINIGLLVSLCLLSQLAFSQTFVPGNIYFDSTNYVEYRAGNLPIIISAPHGGNLEPSSIPDRNCPSCITVQDAYTKPISEGIYDAFFEQTGCYPHVIINLLHRKKFDANREIIEAANGNPTVETAWYGYQAFIDSAKAQIVQDYDRGLFIEIHGHAHTIERIELGYLLTSAELQLPDATIDSAAWANESSIRKLVADNIQNLSHSELLRGPSSFGTLLVNKGFPTVPSSSDPFPQPGEPYFNGGYNTFQHGSRNNAGEIDAIQFELNQEIRFDSLKRKKIIDSLTTSAIEYYNYHYNNQFQNNFCNLILSYPTIDFQRNQLKLYPNPTYQFFNLTSEWKELEITITNCFDQVVATTNWSGEKIEIDFLSSGCYFIHLKNKNEVIGVLKLIKE